MIRINPSSIVKIRQTGNNVRYHIAKQSTTLGKKITKGTVSAGKYAVDTSKSLYNEIRGTQQNLKRGITDGFAIGERLARINDAGKIQTALLKMKGAVRKTEVRVEDLPAVLGSLGFASMIPGGTTTGYVLGKILKSVIMKFK